MGQTGTQCLTGNKTIMFKSCQLSNVLKQLYNEHYLCEIDVCSNFRHLYIEPYLFESVILL